MDPSQGLQNWLDSAYRRKSEKHAACVSEFGGRFVPLVVSSTGAWHADSLRELRKLSNYASARKGIPESDGWKSLLAKVGCALARGNALIISSARSLLRPVTAEGSVEDGNESGCRDYIKFDHHFCDHSFFLFFLNFFFHFIAYTYNVQ